MKLYRQTDDEVTGGLLWEAVRALTPEEESAYHAACAHLHNFDVTHDVFLLVSGDLQAVQAQIEGFKSMIRRD